MKIFSLKTDDTRFPFGMLIILSLLFASFSFPRTAITLFKGIHSLYYPTKDFPAKTYSICTHFTNI
jgi:hypothetical protein